MPQRRLLAALIWVVAGLTASCVPAAPADAQPQIFEIAFPAMGDIDGLPVTVVDRAGAVIDAEIRDWQDVDELGGVEVADDAPDTVYVTWTGGMCDRRTVIRVEVAGGTVRFVESTDRANSCLLAGIVRSIAVRLRDPSAVSALEFVPMDGRALP